MRNPLSRLTRKSATLRRIHLFYTQVLKDSWTYVQWYRYFNLKKLRLFWEVNPLTSSSRSEGWRSNLLSMSVTSSVCQSCGSRRLSVFHKIADVPVHSVLLLPTREAALRYPRGDIALAFCETCGFIGNTLFDPSKHEYSARYEETQGFSPTFSAFHRELAARLVNKYDLRGKSIIEIGCGKGEFLSLLCELGDNRGIGFDPSYVDERNTSSAKDRAVFVKDFYAGRHTAYHADFICCKMTLEHIQHVADFVSTVRRSIGDRGDPAVFFQVPDVTRVLRETAFWDIYYEHCSYFSPGSLARLFRRCGFNVAELTREYDDQYLMLEARAARKVETVLLPVEGSVQDLARDVMSFTHTYREKVDSWKRRLRQLAEQGQRVVVWGSGSKGVAFLVTLAVGHEIEYVVDINPHKHGMYMAGTGQQIVPPDFLRQYKPDVVVVMNPVYLDEITQMLAQMGINGSVVAV